MDVTEEGQKGRSAEAQKPEEKRLKVGLVGVGRWGKTLAASFKKCDVDIVAYDRRSDVEEEGLGRRLPWRRMMSQPVHEIVGGVPPDPTKKLEDFVDIVVAAADPETTAEVAEAALDSWTPAFITKPLLRDPRTVTNNGHNIFDGQPVPYMVDFWRLWSPSWRTMTLHLEDEAPEEICINLYGEGPVRSYPGAHDYGPHVIAFLQDLFNKWEIKEAQVSERTTGQHLVTINGVGSSKRKTGETKFKAIFGNGALSGNRTVVAYFKDRTPLYWSENPNEICLYGRGVQAKEQRLRGLDLQVQHFVDMVRRRGSQSFWSPTIQVACQATSIINDILAGKMPVETKYSP